MKLGRASCEWSLFGGAAVFYAALATNTVQGGDSGELTAVAASFGVAHPPGYPLFTLLGHAAAQIPAGTVAWRVALVSALAAAWTLFALARGLRLAGLSLPACAISVAAIAFSPTFVFQAGVAEVFTLHTAIAATLFWFAASSSPTARIGLRAFLLGLTVGLGGANHHTIVLGFPLAVVAFLKLLAGRSRGRVVAITVAGITAGLAPYLVLVITRDGTEWPRWGDTQTLDGLARHIFRSDYGTFSFGLLRGTESGWDHVAAHLARTVAALGPALLLLAVIGAIRSVRGGAGVPESGLGLASLATWIFSGPLLHALFNNPVDAFGEEIAARFDLFPFVMVGAVAAIGLEVTLRFLASLPRFRAVRVALIAGLGLALALQAAQSVPAAIPERHKLAESYGRDALALLPPHALLFIDGDRDYSVLTYLQEAVRERQDVRVIHVALLGHSWYVNEIRRREPSLNVPFVPGRALSREVMASAHTAGRRVFVTQGVASQMSRADRLAPFGVVVEFLAPMVPTPRPDELEVHLQAIAKRVVARPLQAFPPRAADADIPGLYASGYKQLRGAYTTVGDRAGVQRCDEAASKLAGRFALTD
ncbi:MAG: DUF2723 domain-containing protein [Deltaproteobacteria bacterium]|nr:DUF2723 domain-containing protein [Deltaproteobacteria bacterium]